MKTTTWYSMPNKKSLSEWILRDFPFVLFKICLFIICHRFLHSDGHYFQISRWGHPIWKTCWKKFTKIHQGLWQKFPPFFGHPNAMASWISGQDDLNRNSARWTQFPSDKYVQHRPPYVVAALMRVSVLKLISMDYTIYNHDMLINYG